MDSGRKTITNPRRIFLWQPSLRGRLAILLGGLALLTLVAVGHVASGFAYEFYVFFAPPVIVVAWFAGRRAGYAAVLYAVGAWTFADYQLNPTLGSHPLLFNGLSRLLVYGVNVWLLTQLRIVLLRERRLARQDVLTRLPNRREFTERGRQALGQAQREGTPITAAFIDLDHFKQVNDESGHEAGDALLVRVAAVLAARLRSSDIAARLGGDEFALLLPGMGGATAGIYIEELRQRLLAAMDSDSWPVTFSIGVASYEKAPETLDAMLASADRLMYEVKENGRNYVLSKQF
jgi:diguanylate cyclase (GGDEF)-like protein